MSKFQNIEAEKAIIHILLHHPTKIGEIDGAYIKHTDFTKNVFNELYQIIKQLYLDHSRIEPASIISKGKELNFRFIQSQKNISSIENLFVKKPKVDNLIMYCKIVKNASIRALLSYKLDECRGLVEESTTGIEAISKVENSIYTFGKDVAPDEEIIKLGEHTDKILKELSENPAIGLSTGFPTYDKAIGGGLREGSVHIIGARPKQGKTQVALKIGLHNAEAGIPTLFLDTELQDRDQVPRLVAILMNIPFEALETGKWLRIKDYVKKYKDGKKKLKTLPFYWVRIAGKSLDEIIGIIRRFIMKIVGTDKNGRHNKCLICYDYLKLMNAKDVSRSMQEYQALGYRISQLHDLMGDYNASMLMTLQLNRDGIDREDSAAASQSDRLVWLCDSFTIFKQLSPEELALTHGESNHKLFVSDTRHGKGTSIGQFIGINADKSRAFFQDMGLKRILKQDEDEDEDI